MVMVDTDNIQLTALIDQSGQDEVKVPDILPILPIRNAVLFPSSILPISIGRESSRKLINDIMTGDKFLGSMTQKNPEEDNPSPDDLYPVGTICRIIKMLQIPEDGINVILHGVVRFRIKEIDSILPYIKAKVEIIEDEGDVDMSTEATLITIRQNAVKIVKLIPNVPHEAGIFFQNIDDLHVLMDMVSANLNISVEEKINILYTNG